MLITVLQSSEWCYRCMYWELTEKKEAVHAELSCLTVCSSHSPKGSTCPDTGDKDVYIPQQAAFLS